MTPEQEKQWREEYLPFLNELPKMLLYEDFYIAVRKKAQEEFNRILTNLGSLNLVDEIQKLKEDVKHFKDQASFYEKDRDDLYEEIQNLREENERLKSDLEKRDKLLKVASDYMYNSTAWDDKMTKIKLEFLKQIEGLNK